MPGRHFLPWIAVGLCAMPLAGCGIAQQATSAMLTPFAATSRSIATDVQIATRAISNMATSTAQSSRQISTAANQTAAAQRATLTRYQPAQPVSYQSPAAVNPSRSTKTTKQKAPSQEQRDAALDILPPEILKRLTPDQAGLQRAAQKEAMTAQVGETIFWHIDGREGAAVTENENKMGDFTCRTFVQTIALEDYFDIASIKACRTSDGNWTQSF